MIINIRSGTTKIWINELPDIKYAPIETLKSSFPAKSNEFWENKCVCIEYWGATDHCRYGLLGLSFTPQESKYIDVNVLVSADKDAPFNSPLVVDYEKGYVGIPKTYAIAIQSTVNKIIQHRSFPVGILTFGIGAHSEIGSSQFMFAQITRILIDIIVKDLKIVIQKDIEAIVSAQFSQQ